MMKSNRVSLAIILMVTGFIVVYSYQFVNKDHKSQQSLSAAQWDKENRLREQLIDEQNTNRSLQQKLNKERQEIQEIEQKVAGQKQDVAGLAEQLQEYRMLNGLTEVHGPGIKVTLEDANYVPTNDDPNNYIVHQQDLQEVIYELYAAGAEGVALNGIRLTSHSYIQCVGPVVKIDGQKRTAPFIVEAIGDSDQLMTSLNMSGGTADLLISRGIKLSLEKMTDIQLDPVL